MSEQAQAVERALLGTVIHIWTDPDMESQDLTLMCSTVLSPKGVVQRGIAATATLEEVRADRAGRAGRPWCPDCVAALEARG